MTEGARELVGSIAGESQFNPHNAHECLVDLTFFVVPLSVGALQASLLTKLDIVMNSEFK